MKSSVGNDNDTPVYRSVPVFLLVLLYTVVIGYMTLHLVLGGAYAGQQLVDGRVSAISLVAQHGKMESKKDHPF